MATITARAPASAPAEPGATRHLPELDLLRAVSLLAVAFIHAASWVPGQDAPAQRGPYAAAIVLARFCVPAFLLASGLALSRAGARRPDAGTFLGRRALRTLAPWLAWMPVFAVLDVVTGKVAATPRDLLVWLAYGPGHLYFLLLVAQLSLLVPLLPSRRGRLAALAAAAVALQLVLGALRTHAPLPSGPLAWPWTNLPQMEAPFWAGWFLLGWVAGAWYERLSALSRLWPLALLLTLLGGVLVLAEASIVPQDQWRQGTYSFLWPSRLPATLAVVALLLWLGRELASHAGRAWTPVRALSQRSLGVYVIHVGALEALAHTALVRLPPLARLTVLLVGSVAIAYALTVALARTGAGALALGERPPVRSRPSAAGSGAGSARRRQARSAGR